MIFIFLLAALQVRAEEEKYEIQPFPDLTWKFETTLGGERVQNNLMSRENGASSQLSQDLQFSGILFYSYYQDRMLSKVQLNLGFDQKPPNFFWTDKPDFVHEEKNELIEHLKCVMLDCQMYLPKFYFFELRLMPFVGYSFINYSYNQVYDSSYKDSFMYNSVNVGVEHSHELNRYFTNYYYISYSPLMIVKSFSDRIHYLNYGAGVIAQISRLRLKMFISIRKGAENEFQFLLLDRDLYFNSTEIGLTLNLEM